MGRAYSADAYRQCRRGYRSVTSTRRFPPPWSVEELDACFVVKDGTGQKLAYVYYEEEPGRRSAADLLTRDAAFRCQHCQLPDLIG